MDKEQDRLVDKEQDKKYQEVLSSYKNFYRTWLPIFLILVALTNIMNLVISYVKNLPSVARIILLCIQGVMVTLLVVATIMMVVKVVQFRKGLKAFDKQNISK